MLLPDLTSWRLKGAEAFCCDGVDMKKVAGGLLMQSRDLKMESESDFEVVTQTAPSDEQMKDLAFGWKVVKHVKSNAIVYVKNQATIGIGAGQMSRIDSARIGVEKATSELTGAVMASDAFFPFRDSIDSAAQAGIAAIVQPGGSIRDSEVIQASNEHQIAMAFTKTRHFRH